IGTVAALIIAMGHLVLDLAKIYYVKYIVKEWHEVGLQRGLVFLWDQIGHFLILILLAAWVQNSMWIAETPDQLIKLIIIALSDYFVIYPTAAFVALSTQD